MKLLLTSMAITAVIGLGLLIDAQSESGQSPSAPDISAYRIYAPGRIEGATPEIDLRPEIVGRIVEVLVREGQQVEAGQMVLRLDDSVHRHNVDLARSELAAALAQKDRLVNGARAQERSEADALYRATVAELQQAQNKWERIHRLSATQAIAQQEVDDQKSLIQTLRARADAAKSRADLLAAPARSDEINLADAKIAMAKSQLELAQTELAKTQLRAPSPATVMKLNAEQGELISPTGGQPPVILVDTRVYQVRAFVEELDAPRIKLGMTALITADGMPDQQLEGRVARLSPHMTRKDLFTDGPSERLDTKVREIWIDLPSTIDLVIGLPVDIVIDPAVDRS